MKNGVGDGGGGGALECVVGAVFRDGGSGLGQQPSGVAVGVGGGGVRVGDRGERRQEGVVRVGLGDDSRADGEGAVGDEAARAVGPAEGVGERRGLAGQAGEGDGLGDGAAAGVVRVVNS